MRELERKLTFGNASVGEILAVFEETGITFSAPTLQTDYVFATDESVVVEARPQSVVARVRVTSTAPERPVLTVKQRRQTELDRTEVETSVDDLDSAKELLRLLGLREVVVVTKERREARVDDIATITIDEVQGAGVFAEFEILSESGDADGRLSELVAKSTSKLELGWGEIDKGYDRLLLELQNEA